MMLERKPNETELTNERYKRSHSRLKPRVYDPRKGRDIECDWLIPSPAEISNQFRLSWTQALRPEHRLLHNA